MESLTRREFGLAGAALAVGAASATASQADSQLATFGKRLAHQRQKAGLTISQAAERISGQPADWQAWERGERYPTDSEAWAIAEIFDERACWILAGDAGFVARLRSTRERAGLTIADTAQRVNVSPADWQAWEDNLDEPSMTVGCQIAELFGVDSHWLASGEAA